MPVWEAVKTLRQLFEKTLTGATLQEAMRVRIPTSSVMTIEIWITGHESTFTYVFQAALIRTIENNAGTLAFKEIATQAHKYPAGVWYELSLDQTLKDLIIKVKNVNAGASDTTRWRVTAFKNQSRII